ncbi:hypothetical protein OHA40_01010 [Nocardia sp. NBC_00508]|uniref:hypothetical protein n=1 Tax=Nocardia sp. NBC_00508 TaxID=2975992 RepID=UPI002E807068|nr:hypothetical protein [Nocardia sp. NBC_00508]WUD66783.1 hypothetical protein OHA40_01010 [Nocardia sp. NBC_00508]
MAETMIRTSYLDVSGQPRQGSTNLRESRTDAERYLQPALRAHAAGLHAPGIAAGLQVSAAIGAPGIRIAPGIAIDGEGRHISMAAGGAAKLEDQTLVTVDATGVPVPTTGVSGALSVTIAWAETFDKAAFQANQVFQVIETPIVRLRPAAAFAPRVDEVILAQVDIDSAGNVTALGAQRRRAAGIALDRIEFRRPTTVVDADGTTVGHGPAAVLSVRDDGELAVSSTLHAARGVRLGSSTGLSAAGDAVAVDGTLRLGDEGVELGNSDPAGDFRLATGAVLAGGVRGLRLAAGNGDQAATVFTTSADGKICIGGNAPQARLTVDDPTPDNSWNTAAFRKAAAGPFWSHIHWGPTGDWFIRSAAFHGSVNIQDTNGFGKVNIGGFQTSFTSKVAVGGLPNFGAISPEVYVVNDDSFVFPTPIAVLAQTITGEGLRVSSRDGTGIVASGGTRAAVFKGNVDVLGTLTKSGLNFKIDHPADPAFKFLSHAAVESDEMKNVYDGTVELDGDGAAEVVLPDWFEALNGDFRYQLTAIGAAAPNLHVAQEVSGGRFRIAGGDAGSKVCWMVTGVRRDAYARANPVQVETEKSGYERGNYLHPELHGETAERSLFTMVPNPPGMAGR